MKRNLASIRKIRPEEGGHAVEIWRASVEATHDFLLPGDVDKLDAKVRDFLPYLPLWVATDESDWPVGFMGLSEAHLDSLFIDPAWRGVGIGCALVDHALALHSVLTTEVNEKMGKPCYYFAPTGRSPTDEQGLPYPLIHLRRESARR